MDLPPNTRHFKNGLRVQINYTDSSGKRHRPSTYLPGEITPNLIRQAEVARASLVKKYLIDGPNDEPEVGTMADLLERWFRLRSPRWKQITRDAYDLAYRRGLASLVSSPPAPSEPGDLYPLLWTDRCGSGTAESSGK